MDQILPALRGMLLDHLANSQPITVDLPAGNTVVYVPNTSRFRKGDEVLITTPSTTSGLAEQAWIVDIPEYNQLVISTKDPASSPVTGSSVNWTVANSTQILKAVGHSQLKLALIGDIKIIPDFPAFTVFPEDENNEWQTLRGSSHEFKLTIRMYVLADNFEQSEILLPKYAKQIREILFDHIVFPITPTRLALSSDAPTGSTVVPVSDTTAFSPGSFVFIRDAKKRPFNSQINYVRSILSSTDLELTYPLCNDYLTVRQAEILISTRYLYDGRPSSISYGYVPGSSLMRAASISYYTKEFIDRDPPVILT